MNKLEQAARQALEALEVYEIKLNSRLCNEAITALREALAEQAEQEQNSMFIEGYRIGLAEMREKCAKSVYDSTDWAHEERDMVLKEAIAAAIRAIKFEGDTGFRPVSEMIAEHKQDTKKAAAIEKAKMRKAEQEPVAWIDDLEAMPFNTYCSAIVNWDSYSRDGDSFRKGTGVEIIVVKYKRNDGESAIEFLHTGDDQMLLTSCDVIKWKPLYTPPPTAPNLNCKSVQRRLATSWGYVRKEEYDMARIAAARQMRDAAVKVCEEFAEADLNARSQLEVPSASDIAKAIAALPIPGEEK